MNNKYTHIFFDLDNTLWDFEKNSRNAMFITFGHFKLNTSVEFNLFFETYTKHNHALWESYRNNEVGKKDLTRLRFQNTFAELRWSSCFGVPLREPLERPAAAAGRASR